MPLTFDPFRDTQGPDPYPLYRRLRDEEPAYFAPGAKVYCVSRYDDVVAVLKDHTTFSSNAMQSVLMNLDGGPMNARSILALLRFMWRTRITPWKLRQAKGLIASDPPRHDVLRRIVSRGFTPRRIASWEPRARAIVDAALGDLASRPRFDVVKDLAIPLPTLLIAEVVGVEATRREDFKRWSDTIISAISGAERENPAKSGIFDAFSEIQAYIGAEVERRRRDPADDLISLLVDPAQDGVLDTFDVIQFVMLLLVAGNETTTNLIGNATQALLDRPDPVARVIEDKGVVPALVEEALRFDSPVQTLFREATRDVEIAGRSIPRGSIVCTLLGSANRDERRFEDPDRFDIDRDTSGHVAFGFGVHFCLGAALARLEARVALEGLIPELPRFQRSEASPELIDSFVVRGRRSMEIEAALSQ